MANEKRNSQPGLEVTPGSELPEVVEGPVVENSYDHPAQYPYGHPGPNPPAYPNGVYPSDAYPAPSAYPPSGYVAPRWKNSQDGTYITDQTPPSLPPNGNILGLRRKTFWLIFGPLIALLVIGLAAGLGVGIGTSHKNSSGTTDATPTSTSSSTAAPTAAPTPVTCPNANGTTYQGKGQVPFTVLCNVDYNSAGGTSDIGNAETSSVEDCMGLCSGMSSCAAAGWGSFEGTDTCYMKGSLGTQNDAPNWFFAIKQK
ncbi:hypothetical protein F4779DRAFT_31991 [Xylariaceae sp. FL0662B]|nr:hypothetical protein F4779DRAFT_31991 [Xylariaceae sp. FL0662B]